MPRLYLARIWNTFQRITRGILVVLGEIAKATAGPTAVIWKENIHGEDYIPDPEEHSEDHEADPSDPE